VFCEGGDNGDGGVREAWGVGGEVVEVYSLVCAAACEDYLLRLVGDWG